MKRFSLLLLVLISVAGCASGSPPTAAERAAYDISTTFSTNIVGMPVLEKVGTNIVIVGTNYGYLITTNYFYIERPAVQAVVKTGGTLSALFGAPWLLPLFGLLGALYGGYAKYRNNQADKREAKSEILATVLAQGLETAKEIMVITSPPSVKDKFVETLKSEQVKAGVKPEAAKVASERVDTVAAKDAAVDVLTAAPAVVLPNGQ